MNEEKRDQIFEDDKGNDNEENAEDLKFSHFDGSENLLHPSSEC